MAPPQGKINSSTTLQYLKKPFSWKLGYLRLNRKSKSQSGGEESEVTLPTCIPVSDDSPEASTLTLTAFNRQLDSAVSQYISQVKDLGFKDEAAKDQKLLAVKFKLDPQEIKLKDEVEEDEDTVREILREDKGQQTQLLEEEEEEEDIVVLGEDEVPSLDNPLYLTLSECSSGLLDPFEDHESLHFYENGQVLQEDEHIYENVDNSAGECEASEGEEHLYDTLPRHKPDVPPKPDFLSQLAARQSEPVKRAWNPFVSLSVDTGEPTPPLSTASSLSSPDSSQTDDGSPARTGTNPFRPSAPRDTSEQTILLEGSETSDLGSSGGEYDVVSVEDWPLPPTPPSGEEEVIAQQAPLPPPPPEIALQQLEEEVLRQEEEDRRLALQKAKQAIEREYGNKAPHQEAESRVEAVNTSLQQRLSTGKEAQPVKEPKIIQIDQDDGEEFETPAIRHSVIIELKDSCPGVPKSLKPSDVRKESVRRSQSLKFAGVVRKSSTGKVSRRESLTRVFPSLQDQLRKPGTQKDPVLTHDPVPSKDSVTAKDISPAKNTPTKEAPHKNTTPKFSFLEPCGISVADSAIDISDDGSWEMKDTSVEDVASTGGRDPRPDLDPFTGSPIAAPPLSPVAIAAPPVMFQNEDGVDGVFCASVVSTHSGPSSLASVAPDSLQSEMGSAEVSPPPETIPEETFEPDSLASECESPRGKCVRNEAPTSRNLGAAIMEQQEMELQRKKDNLNLPEHSLLEFGDTVRDLEEQRRSVIKQMTVKAKRKDTWIKTFNMHDHGSEESIPVAPSRSRRKNSPSRPGDPEAPAEPQPCPVKAPQIPGPSGPPKGPAPENTVVVPAKAVRKKKASAEPQQPPAVVEEKVITPKNTEALAALFSSPTKTNGHAPTPTSSPSKKATTEGQAEEAPHTPPRNTETPPCKVPDVPDVPDLLASLETKVPEEATDEAPVPDQTPDESEAAGQGQNETPADATVEGEDSMVKEKNELNLVHSAMVAVCEEEGDDKMKEEAEEKKEGEEAISPPPQDSTTTTGKANDQHADQPLGDEGEVEYFSILDNKPATKSYWETRMLATMDDGGWESVANVRYQALTAGEGVMQQPPQVPDDSLAVPPPPQFDNSPNESEESSPPSLDDPPTPAPDPAPETRPAKQYVYGVTNAPPTEMRGARIVETVAKKPASQENIIEAEIRAQQLKENEMRRQQTVQKNTEVREKGASSPASHDSDEGFVDRLEVTGPHPTLAAAPGYTHTIPGTDGEPVIYDAVSPPPSEYLSDRSTPTPSNPPVTITTAAVAATAIAAAPTNATEARIALEIRELKEREDELRQMREMMSSRENLLEDEEVRSSASREQLMEDHLTSLTTTTDEGNFSECGDPASSEDKSSDGSNSRMMSPDLHHHGSHLEFGRRRVTVKPYEEEDEEDQPVYTRMQKESVIEREIRLAREREEAYRREKGLLNGSAPLRAAASTPAAAPAPVAAPVPAPAVPRLQVMPQADGRDVQHRMATSRIQLEIQETSQKEKELRDAGKILTMSEDTVDAKVTRMSDFNDMSPLESPRSQAPSISSAPRPSTSTTPASTPKRCLSPRSPSSPVPNFTPSPALNRNGLSRSLSTNNLSTTSTTRPPKGLMQKFIASRGKMTGSAFVSPPPTLTHTTSRGVPTRPMRVEPKAVVVQRETLAKMKPEPEAPASPKQYYRRSYCTAEEKIQSELKEMQKREEELRRLRAFQMAQSQPNLLDIGGEDEHDLTEEEESNHSLSDMNGLRSALSNPNLLDEPEQFQVQDKTVRRRSALIAQWENRIQQTTDT
ncbi:titin-like isoform X3 [Eriocheir sinensis]|uniref:titin-like isoform X3 n=1 Tax=Eriocheir sinensis TaxID=95602 RepID=UPI0021CAAC87|nr:titin-like isoform X3 [Eriocheir sinensis]